MWSIGIIPTNCSTNGLTPGYSVHTILVFAHTHTHAWMHKHTYCTFTHRHIHTYACMHARLHSRIPSHPASSREPVCLHWHRPSTPAHPSHALQLEGASAPGRRRKRGGESVGNNQSLTVYCVRVILEWSFYKWDKPKWTTYIFSYWRATVYPTYVHIYICTRCAMEMGPCNTTPMKTCKSDGPGQV